MSDYSRELAAILGVQSSGEQPVSPLTTPLPGPPVMDGLVPAVPSVEPVVEEGRTFGQAAREFGGRTLAFGLGALEPLQFTQDALFAVLAGARDQEKSVGEYWSEVVGQFGSYAPFGDAPARVSSGSDILGLYGVEDENVRRFGGFALDVFADPLLVGGAITGLGRAARVLGAADAGQSLMNFGRAIDDGLSLIPVQRGGEWRGIPVTASRVLPEPAREAVAQGMEGIVISLANMPALQGLLRILPQSVEARARLGRETGGEVFAAGGRAAQAGETVREFGLEVIDRVVQWLGPDSEEFLRGIRGGLAGRASAFTNIAGRFRTETRDALLRQLAVVADRRGIAFLDPDELVSAGRAGAPLIAGTEDAIGFLEIAGQAASQLRAGVRAAGENLLDRAIKNIRDVAARNNDDVDRAEQAFRESLKLLTESDALTGYALSMIGPIGRRFLSTVSERFASLPAGIAPVMDAAAAADSLWLDVLRRGMRGEDVYNLERIAVGTGRVRPLVSVEDILGTRTLGDFINQNEFFADLNLNSYLRSLNEGHLRRSFGVFMDERTFNNYMASLTAGRLMPSSVLDENKLLGELKKQGFSVEADLINDYVQTLRGTAMSREVSTTPGMGLIVRRERLLAHLLENGVDPRQAQGALDALTGMTNSRAYQAFVEKVRTKLEDYRQLFEEPAEGSGGFLRARQDLPEDMLEVLAEIANPLISIEESTRFGRRRIETTDYMRRVYDIALKAGLVSDSYREGLSAVALRGSRLYGPFQGKYMHPAVERFITRALRRADFRTDGSLQQLTAFIRGGYLAGPNILNANISGGLTTSAYLGLNPFAMLGEMAGVLRDMARRERGVISTIPDMDELLQFIPLNLTRMGDIAEVERGVRELRRSITGRTSNALREGIDRLGSALRTFVDNPAELVMGQRAAGAEVTRRELFARGLGATFGLQGFTTSETVMKLAAFRLARRQGYTISEAAEMARLSTFDYSELPDLLDAGRRAGVLLFPGFSYFILGRTVGGLLRRPGVVGASNRLPDAIVDAQGIDEDTKNTIVASMEPWLQNDIGIPVRSRELPDGGTTYSMFPYAAFIPGLSWTQGALGPVTPFGESLSNLGLMGPGIVDPLTAIMTGSGEGPLGARYGQQVFLPGQPLEDQVAQVMGYFYNSFAPATMRRAVGFRAGEGFTGIVPAVIDSMVELPEEFAGLGYDRNTILNRQVKRDLVDEVIGALARSVFPVTVGGQLPTIARTYQRAESNLRQELRVIEDLAERALLDGDQARYDELVAQYQEKVRKFGETWRPRIEEYRQATGLSVPME